MKAQTISFTIVIRLLNIWALPLLIWAPSLWAQGPVVENDSCVITISQSAKELNEKAFMGAVLNHIGIEAESTPTRVWFMHDDPAASSDPDFLYLAKSADEPVWRSHFDPTGMGTVPQGDARWVIYLFGVEIAYDMGFRIKISPHNDTVIRGPKAHVIREWKHQVNEELIEAGHEPMGYSLVSTGVIEEDEIFDVSVCADGGARLCVPYFDQPGPVDMPNAFLGHEWDYHFGPYLLKEHVLRKVEAISLRTQILLDLLKRNRRALGASFVTTMTRKIKAARGSALDLGTGNLSHIFAYYRVKQWAASLRGEKPPTSKEFFDRYRNSEFLKKTYDEWIGEVSMLAGPEQSPTDLVKDTAIKNLLSAANAADAKPGLKEKLTEIAAKFETLSRQADAQDEAVNGPYESMSADEFLERVLKEAKDRRSEIRAAARRVRAKREAAQAAHATTTRDRGEGR